MSLIKKIIEQGKVTNHQVNGMSFYLSLKQEHSDNTVENHLSYPYTEYSYIVLLFKKHCGTSLNFTVTKYTYKHISFYLIT